MAMNLVKLPTGKSNLQLRVSKGHYATSHSHINYYIDVTLTKFRLSEARAAAAELVREYKSTTLHYAPCSAKKAEGFRVIIVLPKGTNEEMPSITPKNDEDKMLWAANKWLIAHKDTAEAKDGAHVGITGENVDIIDLI